MTYADTQNSLPRLPGRHLARVVALLADGHRKLLGLAGPPGAGKSTLAAALHRAFPEVSQIVPMDGFHFASAELRRLGLADRKGAPETFDASGYVSLLQRLRDPSAGDIVYAPEFRREIEEPVAGAIGVLSSTRLVITEGNYLLLGEDPWTRVPALLDDVWYLDVDDALRTDRLTRRHEAYGRSRGEAVDWVATVDDANALRVRASRGRAQHHFRWDDDDAV